MGKKQHVQHLSPICTSSSGHSHLDEEPQTKFGAHVESELSQGSQRSLPTENIKKRCIAIFFINMFTLN
jgi:hypothetical protein